MAEPESLFGDPISIYTRAQALEDGELVDVTEWASADKGFLGGYRVPVALTRAAWATIENIPKSLKGIADVRGRAHDVLFLSSLALKGAQRRGEPSGFFRVILPHRGSRKRKVTLRVDLSGGDDGEPVVTIGYSEDF